MLFKSLTPKLKKTECNIFSLYTWWERCHQKGDKGVSPMPHHVYSVEEWMGLLSTYFVSKGKKYTCTLDPLTINQVYAASTQYTISLINCTEVCYMPHSFSTLHSVSLRSYYVVYHCPGPFNFLHIFIRAYCCISETIMIQPYSCLSSIYESLHWPLNREEDSFQAHWSFQSFSLYLSSYQSCIHKTK